MKELRLFIPLVLVIAFGVLIYVIGSNRMDISTTPALAPAFQLAGESTQLIDRAASKVIPVEELDEKELGDIIAGRAHTEPQDSATAVYLNACMSYLIRYSKQPFEYRVFVHPSDVPNAFALPGGVVYVTRGLLKTMRSESELIAVMAHEMGHIELGHCFNSVKFELLARKAHGETLGKIADFAVAFLLRPSFSKTQENESDEYAYRLMIESQYDPRGLAFAFNRLADSTGVRRENGILDAYFSTHPSLELRYTKFLADADQWWSNHREERRYIGRKNLTELKTMEENPAKDEWFIYYDMIKGK